MSACAAQVIREPAPGLAQQGPLFGPARREGPAGRTSVAADAGCATVREGGAAVLPVPARRRGTVAAHPEGLAGSRSKPHFGHAVLNWRKSSLAKMVLNSIGQMVDSVKRFALRQSTAKA